MAEDEAPKIHIDSDWKAEAQQEKDRLEQEESTQEERPPLGKPTMMHLINTLAMQAAIGFGGMQGPDGRRIEPDLEAGRFHIDMLSVLEEKTVGNLTDEEKEMLTDVLHKLRMAYVQITQTVADVHKD